MSGTEPAGGEQLGPRIEVGSPGETADGLTLDQIAAWMETARRAGVPGGVRPFGAVVAGRVTRLFTYPPRTGSPAC